MSAAAQARRLRPAGDLDIVVLEQGPEISYSACGIPYWIGDQVSDRDALHRPHPGAVRGRQDISVRTTRPRRGDRPGRRARCAPRTGGGTATTTSSSPPGGRPARPPVPGPGRRRRLRRPPAGRRRRHPGRHRRGRDEGRRPRRWLHRPGDGRGAAGPGAVGHRRPRRPAAHGPARRRHGRADLQGHGRHGHRRPERTSPCARSRWTPTARSGRCAPTRAATTPTSSSSAWAWARRRRWRRRPACRSASPAASTSRHTQRSRSHPEVFAAGDCVADLPPHHRRGASTSPSAPTPTSRAGSRARSSAGGRPGSPASWGRR